MPTRIIFVRHGETEFNVKSILQGHSNSSLTINGKNQINKLGERLKKEKIDVAYISDLKRTKETAKEILKYHSHIKPVYDKNIREINLGIYEKRNISELEKAFKRSKKDFSEFKPRGGESRLDLRKRVEKFFAKTLQKDKNKTILIVSHGIFILSSLLHLLNESRENYKKYRQSNTGVTIITITNKKSKLVKLNCTKHLE